MPVYSDLTRELREAISPTCQNLTTTLLSQHQDLCNKICAIVPGLTQTLDRGLIQVECSVQERLERLERTVITALHPTGIRDKPCAIALGTAQDGLGATQLEVATLPRVSLMDSLGCRCSIFPVQADHTRNPSTTCIHEERCPLSYGNRKHLVAKHNLRLFGWLFQVKIGINYSRYTLRDLQIHPNFTVRATVQFQQSPAFRIVQQTVYEANQCSILHRGDKNKMVAELEKVFQNCLRTLQEIFSAREAWLTDVDPEGNNLLHVRLLKLAPRFELIYLLTGCRLQLCRWIFLSMRRWQWYICNTGKPWSLWEYH